VVGLVRPNQGDITLDGQSIRHLPMHQRARKGIGYLAQEPSVFRKLSVEENIIAIWQMRGVPRARQREWLETILNQFQIAHIRTSKGAVLSGGERRRVEIARAMATEPSFLLLDEPFAGIDPIAVGEIQKMVRQLKEKGLGILITDHSVEKMLRVIDRGYILAAGKILEHGDPDYLAQSEIAKKVYLGEDFTLS
jgi:lipopolysaccharide export system ATP-binding protein